MGGRRVAVLVSISALVGACSGGDDSSSPTTTAPPASTRAPASTTSAPAATTTTTPASTAPAPSVIPAAFWGITPDGRVVSLDPATLQVVDEFPVVAEKADQI